MRVVQVSASCGRMKREPGANPGQARCCDRGQRRMMSLSIFGWEDAAEEEPEVRKPA